MEQDRETCPATVVDTLAAWSSQLAYEDIPDRVLEKARYQVMSVLGALHGGREAEEVKAVRRAVVRWHKGGPCTVLPWGDKMALHEALLLMSVCSMALEFDDYLYLGHTGHSAVLASWAICQEEGLTTREMLVAQVIANEVEGRLGASCALGPQNGQTWSFIHAVGAAALASRLYRLDQEQTAHAMAISLLQPPYPLWPAFFGSSSKVLTAAWPTVAGVQSAQFAREGLTGSLDVIDHSRRGLWSLFTHVPLPAMISGLGRAWVTDALAYKAYPGCAYLGTTLDALFSLMEEARTSRGLSPDDIRAIHIEASLLTVEMDNLSTEMANPLELSPVAINFSASLTVALAILAGRLTPKELAPRYLKENEGPIRALARRVSLTHRWEMTLDAARSLAQPLGLHTPPFLPLTDALKVIQGYQGDLIRVRKKSSLRLASMVWHIRKGLLSKAAHMIFNGATQTPQLLGEDLYRLRMMLPAKVNIVLRGGRTLSARRDIPSGAPGDGRRFQVAENKLLAASGPLIPPSRLEKAVEMIRHLEEVSLEELSSMVCLGE